LFDRVRALMQNLLWKTGKHRFLFPYLQLDGGEPAVNKLIQGRPVLNRDALRNSEVLDSYRDLRELQAA
jgi:hypothetical protein